MRAPPTVSLWPFRNLVVECTTMSIPIASGRWKKGVMKVLSTTEMSLCFFASFAAARKSVSVRIGFVGVSM